MLGVLGVSMGCVLARYRLPARHDTVLLWLHLCLMRFLTSLTPPFLLSPLFSVQCSSASRSGGLGAFLLLKRASARDLFHQRTSLPASPPFMCSAASDFGGLEVFGGASIGHTDPFKVAAALRAVHATLPPARPAVPAA